MLKALTSISVAPLSTAEAGRSLFSDAVASVLRPLLSSQRGDSGVNGTSSTSPRAGMNCMAIGTIQPFSPVSDAYARDMQDPHRFPMLVNIMMEPDSSPRTAAGATSALYDGTTFSTIPTA